MKRFIMTVVKIHEMSDDVIKLQSVVTFIECDMSFTLSISMVSD